MHPYRSHTCAALRKSDTGATVRLSGWVHRVRDHGGVLFIDLRDHYGLTQVVADPDSPAFKAAETVRGEWVIRVDGHTDDTPLRLGAPFRDNWELSQARALSVVRYLISQGVPPDRLVASGFGEFQPRADNASSQGQALNRRIEIIMLPDLQPLPDLVDSL